MGISHSEAYAAAGVNIEAGYEGVKLMKKHVQRTMIPGVVSDIGGFGGLFAPDLTGMSEPVLVSGTDGVGTKQRIAQLMNKHDSVGIDCVAMCVNDIICCGAKPIFFLDYIAIGKNEPEKVATLVSGVAEGCVQSGCALIGGETAEHPGTMSADDYDLAGFAVGIVDRAKFIDLLERAAQDKTPIVDVDDVWERRDFEVLPAGGMVNRTRAMLKVEDGCVNFCTYCLIPYARGRVRSLPMDEAAKQVKALREEGYREIVVTGIEISSYGSDFKDGTSLIDLLELIAREGGDMRIRLGSLEPRTITEEFCKRASKLPYLCPHFHLSMQSGCDATLKRMNRKYDTARYMESCDLLRQYFDDPAITTDLITGFPEETEEEFAQTLDFIARVGFADMHVFPYSIRPGTKAAEMRQIDMPVREERAARASAVAKTMHEAYLACCVGKIFPVLFERDRKGGSAGHAPNYMEVSVAQEGLHNQVKNVKITAVDGGSLRGELEE